jgi:hypothetical protein
MSDAFIKGLKNYNISYDDIRANKWKYCGGDTGRHANYFRQCFPLDVYTLDINHEDHCICGHYIVENCFITNDEDEILVLGNCCIKKFIPRCTRTCELCKIPHKNRKDNKCNTCRIKLKEFKKNKGLLKKLGDDSDAYKNIFNGMYDKLTVNGIDNPICRLCLNFSVGRGHSDRYEDINCFTKEDEGNLGIPLCDICAEDIRDDYSNVDNEEDCNHRFFLVFGKKYYINA